MKIRLIGIVLLVISLVGFHWLSHGFELAGLQHWAWLEISVGAISVSAFLLGLPMMALGSGFSKDSEISWPGGQPARRKRPPHGPEG